jgi:phosphoribosylformylglycinamidine synthase
VVRIHGKNKGIVSTVDCNARYVAANPYVGTMIAVSEAARNIVCSGGEPLAVTNCLNFGNPYKPEIYWHFVKAIEGMGEACRKFNTPVTGGNVSFYNQNEQGPVFPTPTIGMVGRIEDLSLKTKIGFEKENATIYLLGNNVEDLASSEYMANLKSEKQMPAPYFNLDEEAAIQNGIYNLIRKNLVASCHDVADGGIWTALCESSFINGIGFEIQSTEGIRKDAFLFGEAQGRALLTSNNDSEFEAFCISNNIPFSKIGVTKGTQAIVDSEDYGQIATLKNLFDTSIEKALAQ